jgi:hypothetical protein
VIRVAQDANWKLSRNELKLRYRKGLEKPEIPQTTPSKLRNVGRRYIIQTIPERFQDSFGVINAT